MEIPATCFTYRFSVIHPTFLSKTRPARKPLLYLLDHLVALGILVHLISWSIILWTVSVGCESISGPEEYCWIGMVEDVLRICSAGVVVRVRMIGTIGQGA